MSTPMRALCATLLLAAGVARAGSILTPKDFGDYLDGLTGFRLQDSGWNGVPFAMATYPVSEPLPRELPGRTEDDSIIARLEALQRRDRFMNPLQVVVVFPVFIGSTWQAPVSIPGAPPLTGGEGPSIAFYAAFQARSTTDRETSGWDLYESGFAPLPSYYWYDRGPVQYGDPPVDNPEPATVGLLLGGVGGLVLLARRRRRAS